MGVWASLAAAAAIAAGASQELPAGDESQHGTESAVQAKPQAATQQAQAPSPASPAKPQHNAATGRAATDKHGTEHPQEAPKWTDRVQAIVAILVGLFTAVLTFVGVEQWRLLKNSTAESAQALAVATKSADAAIKTGEAMEANVAAAHAAERAYMFLGVDPIVRTGLYTLNCKVTITNAGRSPGIVKAVYYKIYFARPDGEVVLFEPDGRYSETELALSPGSDRPGFEFILNVFRTTPYFYGFVVYEDIFRKFHVSKCCVQIDTMSLTTTTDGTPCWNEWD